MKARIIDGVVAEILVPVSGFTVEQCFHPDILAQCVDVPDSMQVGDVYPPVVEETSVETPVETSPVTE